MLIKKSYFEKKNYYLAVLRTQSWNSTGENHRLAWRATSPPRVQGWRTGNRPSSVSHLRPSCHSCRYVSLGNQVTGQHSLGRRQSLISNASMIIRRMYWTSPVTGAFNPQQLEEGTGHCLCACGHPGPRPVRPTKRLWIKRKKKKRKNQIKIFLIQRKPTWALIFTPLYLLN